MVWECVQGCRGIMSACEYGVHECVCVCVCVYMKEVHSTVCTFSTYSKTNGKLMLDVLSIFSSAKNE